MRIGKADRIAFAGVEEAGSRVLNYYEYDAFGNTTVIRETVKNRFRYDGEQYDAVMGQYYLRARYYNPVIGRFTQEDTYYGDGLNLYAYCGNNPVGYEDPSGHDGCPVQKKVYSKDKNKQGKSGDNGTSPDLEKKSNSSSGFKAGDKTPRGREYTKHGAERANERGFDSQKIDSIIDNNYKSRVKEIDKVTGEVTWRYQDKRGNTVITNETGDKIVTVYSYPRRKNQGNYISKK